MKKLLFLDDFRNPFSKEIDWMIFSPIGRDVEIHWVKTHFDFVAWVLKYGLPDGICFDHDLCNEHYRIENTNEAWEKYYNWSDRERTGYDSAKFICNYCDAYDLGFPPYVAHTANPIGRKNITSYIENFKKFRNGK